MEYKYKALLVEDDEDDYILFSDYLSEMPDLKVELTWISEYDEARDTILKNTHDIYILDYRLGEHTGIELLREAAVNQSSKPFIFLTGQGNREIDLEAMNAGASDYLVKSEINPYLLERSIRYAIERSRLMEEIRQMSLTDELTGLNNRKGFMALAEQQLKLAARSKILLSLLFADLDNMKWINDNLGHEQGDEALISLAAIIKDSFRESDVCARLGGDEFTVMILDCDKEKAEALNKRMLDNIEAFNKTGEHEFKLKLSTGVAHYEQSVPISLDALISEADELMYEQKKIHKGEAVRGKKSQGKKK